MIENAPAKLNLALHVIGRLPNGYHALESLVAFTELGDTVSVEASERDRFRVVGPFAKALEGSGPNLIERARDVLRDHIGSASPVAIKLTKNLPVASGIGGGSSDAASTLRALSTQWGIGAHQAEQVALNLGSDVPMCLLGQTAIATGQGEHLRPVLLPALAQLHVVLVNPLVPVSTPNVFAALHERENPPLPRIAESFGVTEFLRWLGDTRNDLQLAACRIAPEIEDVLDALRDAEFARMSGSGATCFGLYTNGAEAEAARARIARDQPGWFVARTRFREGNV